MSGFFFFSTGDPEEEPLEVSSRLKSLLSCDRLCHLVLVTLVSWMDLVVLTDEFPCPLQGNV